MTDRNPEDSVLRLEVEPDDGTVRLGAAPLYWPDLPVNTPFTFGADPDEDWLKIRAVDGYRFVWSGPLFAKDLLTSEKRVRVRVFKSAVLKIEE